jgi:hypothetical protein
MGDQKGEEVACKFGHKIGDTKL